MTKTEPCAYLSKKLCSVRHKSKLYFITSLLEFSVSVCNYSDRYGLFIHAVKDLMRKIFVFIIYSLDKSSMWITCCRNGELRSILKLC